jgi:hypothetical protein
MICIKNNMSQTLKLRVLCSPLSVPSGIPLHQESLDNASMAKLAKQTFGSVNRGLRKCGASEHFELPTVLAIQATTERIQYSGSNSHLRVPPKPMTRVSSSLSSVN